MVLVTADSAVRSPQKAFSFIIIFFFDKIRSTVLSLTGRVNMQGDSDNDLTNAAIWVYGIAFDELRRQIATESKDRAELLAATWDHFFSLVELRTALQYEKSLSDAEHMFEALRRERSVTKDTVKGFLQKMQNVEEVHAAAVFQKDAQMRAIAQVCVVSIFELYRSCALCVPEGRSNARNCTSVCC